MAGWLPPLEPDEHLHLAGCVLAYDHRGDDEPAYDPYAEQNKTPTERQYDEMNREERLDGLA